MNFPPSTAPKLSCRMIDAELLPAAKAVLVEGFSGRSQRFWARALDRLSQRQVPEGYPRYGYILMSGDTAVGCLLTIFSSVPGRDGPEVRCNFASFYTRPQYRFYAALMTRRALKHPAATFLDITPRPDTLELLQAEGYHRFCEGTLVLAAWLRTPAPGVEVVAFDPTSGSTPGLTDAEHQLLADHAALGCVSLVCRSANGASPFVFQHRQVWKRMLPATHLIYCRNLDDFVENAGNLGRYLARKGALLTLVDCDDTAPRLTGLRLAMPKYFKGPVRPRLADLSYTELPILGI